jgi:hypothetical protein
MTAECALKSVKALHTAVWAVFVACIFCMPVLAYRGRFGLAALAGGAVLIESLVIIFNRGKCPLTAIAARYTGDRRANFDICLPEWLARYNKEVFGALYAAGLLYSLFLWRG